MQTAAVSGLYEQLSEEDKALAVDYLKFLVIRSREKKAEGARKAFAEVDAVLQGETGWKSEEEMIEDLAAFRRSRQGR